MARTILSRDGGEHGVFGIRWSDVPLGQWFYLQVGHGRYDDTGVLYDGDISIITLRAWADWHEGDAKERGYDLLAER